MRRLEFLLTEVRNSTDNTDTNGVKTPEIVGYYNDAQKFITTMIFKNNPYCDLFKAQSIQSAVSSNEYTLPSNCFAVNAVSMVEVKTNTSNNNDGYVRIKPIMESEFAFAFGYITRDNKVIISGQDNISWFSDVRITYFKQLPTLDVRQAKVASTIANTSITCVAAPTDLYTISDHCSTVDALGDQVVSDIYFTNTSGLVLTTTTTTGVDNTQYIVSGADACNRPLLPDACEPYLQDYVRQRIYTRNNYDDANKQMYFTELRQAEIISIFSKNKKDDDTIPTTDTEFLSW